MPMQAVSSSQLVAIDATEESTTSSTPVKLKEFVIDVAGTYRAKFSMLSATAGAATGFAQLYVNAVVRGGTHNVSGLTWVQQVEDISVGVGDLLQLYVWHYNGSAAVSVNSFSISASWQDLPPAIPARVS